MDSFVYGFNDFFVSVIRAVDGCDAFYIFVNSESNDVKRFERFYG